MTKSVGNELVLLHESMDYYYSSSCASSGNENRAVMNPKELRFTQSDIKLYYHEEAAGLIRQRRLDPVPVSGKFIVQKDEEGLESVKVKLNNDFFKSTSQDEKKLNDPAFTPRIGSGSGSGKEPSLPEMVGAVSGAVAAGFAAWELYKLATHQSDDRSSPCGGVGNEKRAEMNPKNLRFTQPDIAPYFKNPTYPGVEEAVTLIRQGRLDPAVFGELTVHRDREEKGLVWCENNRSLYVLRKAGVKSVKVKFIKNDFRSRYHDKTQLKNPGFMPRIRGGTSRNQIPTKSAAVPGSMSSYQEEKGSSLQGMMGAVSGAVAVGCAAWKLFNLFTQSEDADQDKDNK